MGGQSSAEVGRSLCQLFQRYLRGGRNGRVRIRCRIGESLRDLPPILRGYPQELRDRPDAQRRWPVAIERHLRCRAHMVLIGEVEKHVLDELDASTNAIQRGRGVAPFLDRMDRCLVENGNAAQDLELRGPALFIDRYRENDQPLHTRLTSHVGILGRRRAKLDRCRDVLSGDKDRLLLRRRHRQGCPERYEYPCCHLARSSSNGQLARYRARRGTCAFATSRL